MARAGARDTAILDVLTEQGHKPARGGVWRLSTIGRISGRAKGREPRVPDAARFWSKVEADAETSCLVWLGRLHEDGYGLAEVDGRNVLAHRWAYEERHGALTAGVQLHHACRNKRCVNPAHLLPATAADHAATERDEDAVIAGIRRGDFERELEDVEPASEPSPAELEALARAQVRVVRR